MKKINDFMKNKKLMIVSGIVFVAFLICVVGNMYISDVISYTNMYYNSSSELFPQVGSGDVFEQEFILREGDEGVAIKFATNGTIVSDGTIKVEVCNANGTVVSEFIVPATEISNDSYCNFVFKDVAEELWNQKSLLRLTFLGIEMQTIGIYASDEVVVECTCIRNGVEQSANLVTRGLQHSWGLGQKDIRFLYLFAFVMVLSYIAYKTKLEILKEKLKQAVIVIRNNVKKMILSVVIVFASGIITYFRQVVLIPEGQVVNPNRCALVFVFYIIIGMTILFYKYIWKYAHVYFFVLAMLTGMFIIYTVPPIHISWDEQIHYWDTTYMSWGANGRMSEADYALSMQPITTFVDNPFQKANIEERIATMNSYSMTDMVKAKYTLTVRSIAYVPGSIGLHIGRVLDLSVYHTFMLGKVANLFCYALFIALAIRNLQGRGKIIVSALGLIPTSLFMAASYAYDWWVISLVMLGFSIFIGELQKHGKISTIKILESLVVLVIGILPKAVYFPLLFPLMTLKKEHYEESKKSRILVVLGMLVLLASFILPLFMFGAGEGDVRGGTDVDSTAQIKFILFNLFGYAQILLNFLKSYFSPDMAYEYITHVANIGFIRYTEICIIMITVAAIVDNSENAFFSKKTPWLKWAACLGVLGAIVLVATALYVSFTPVAAQTINGCQYRYLLPVIFPFLFFVGEGGINVTENQKKGVFILVSLAMVFVMMSGWNDVAVSMY